MPKTSFLALALLFAPVVHASEPAAAPTPSAIAEAALRQIDHLDFDGWGYRMTTESKDGSRVEEHDPTSSETWRLISVDGRAPTAAELADYRKEKRDEASRKAEAKANEKSKKDAQADDKQVSIGLDTDSLELVSNDGERMTFRVGFGKSDELDLSRSVGGTLLVHVDPPFVERLVIRNHDTVKGPMHVRLEKFLTEMSWELDPASRAILPVSIVTEVKGKVLFVKSIDESMTIRYSDWRRTAAPPAG